MEILIANLGLPIENRNVHGKKFTLVDKCDGELGESRIFITLYLTGNMLFQAEGNRQMHEYALP